MPRHLDVALDRLSALGPEIEALVSPWTRVEDCAPEVRTLSGYARSWGTWSAVGLEIAEPARRRVRALWSERPDLRPVLRALIGWYPCREFEAAWIRSTRRSFWGDFVGWLRFEPRLRAILLPVVQAEARRFNQIDRAIRACLVWARYFDGGDDAFRAFALALNRHDRVHAKTHLRDPWREDFVRHDLNDHGTVTPGEAARINVHLEALGAEPLDLGWIAAPGWWKADPPEAWRSRSALQHELQSAKEASREFAGDRWSAADEASYQGASDRLQDRSGDQSSRTTG